VWRVKIDRRDVEKNLRKKGFTKETAGRKHVWFNHKYKGRETSLRTCVSHSPAMKDISGDLLTQMRKQLRLDTSQEVVDLVKCPMDGDAYNQKMIQKGVFEP
jgi:predicted RNA binding protein YcfA (HicA-like mRNA interferase family)